MRFTFEQAHFDEPTTRLLPSPTVYGDRYGQSWVIDAFLSDSLRPRPHGPWQTVAHEFDSRAVRNSTPIS